MKTRIDPMKLYQIMQRDAISQNELARRAGISKSTISLVMNGHLCSSVTGGKICQAVRAEPEELLEVVEE